MFSFKLDCPQCQTSLELKNTDLRIFLDPYGNPFKQFLCTACGEQVLESFERRTAVLMNTTYGVGITGAEKPLWFYQLWLEAVFGNETCWNWAGPELDELMGMVPMPPPSLKSNERVK